MVKTLRDFTFFELYWNDKYSAFRHLIGLVEREFNLLLDETAFSDRSACQADNYNINGLYSLRNFQFPVLTRQNFFFIKPRINTVFTQICINFSDPIFVFRSMTEEYP